MLYGVCVERMDGKTQLVAVEAQSKSEARRAARGFRFVSRRTNNPIIYVRRIDEYEYLNITDDFMLDARYYGEIA